MKFEQSQLELAARVFFSEQAKNLATGEILTEKLPEVSLYKQYSSEKNSNSSISIYLNGNGKGWVALSSDNRLSPIYAHTNEDTSEMVDDCPPLNNAMEEYVYDMDYVLEKIDLLEGKNDNESLNFMKSIATNEEEWERLFRGETTFASLDGSNGVEDNFLIGSKWNQDGEYNGAVNRMCQSLVPCKGQYPVGCVGIAVAQILRYWGYRGNLQVKFNGEIKYEWGIDGKKFPLSIQLDNKNYNFYHMPEVLWSTSPSDHKGATTSFLLDVALMVQSQFETSGTGSNIDRVENLFRKHIINCESGETTSYHGQPEFWGKIINSVQAGRPVYYQAYNGGGHAMIIDGYYNHRDRNARYHFNMGWGIGQNYWGKDCHQYKDNRSVITGFYVKP